MTIYGQYDVPSSDTMVNLGVGQPDKNKLPLDLIKYAMNKICNNEDNKELLQYGDLPGYPRFRKKLVKWLQTRYPDNTMISEDRVFIDNGITNGIQLILDNCSKSKDFVFVEESSYFIMMNIFNEYGLKVIPVKMDNEGMVIGDIRDYLSDKFDSEINYFIYTIPFYQNPTGVCMSEQRKEELVELCEKYNTIVISDEVYQFLGFEDEKTRPLADYHNNMISLGSFSKILAPSLRLGWVYQKNTNKIDIIYALKKSSYLDSSGGTGVISSRIVEELLEPTEGKNYIDNYITECQEFLSSRCKVLEKTLLESKNKGFIDFITPKGGYFLWIKLNNIDSDEFLKLSKMNRVSFHQGWKFDFYKKDFKQYIRLSFSYYNEDDLEISANRINQLLSIYHKTKVVIQGKGKLGSKIIELVEMSENYYLYDLIDRETEIKSFPDNSVIIDVSSSQGTNRLINQLLYKQIYVPLIIGTTGDINMDNVYKYSKFAPVAKISNFSEGIPLVNQLVKLSNSLSEDWKFKINETHHIQKLDSPSGTAKTLKSNIYRDCDIGSFREGNEYGYHKIVLENDDEKIEISHKAKSRDLFAKGAIKYINWIKHKKNGIYYYLDNNYSDIEFKTYSAGGNILMIVENYEKNKKDFVNKVSQENDKLDGVIFIEKLFKWEYYNRDGNKASFCGNGIRCILKYLKDKYNINEGQLENDDVGDINFKDNMFSIDINQGEYDPTSFNFFNYIPDLRDNLKKYMFVNIDVCHLVLDMGNKDVFEMDKSKINIIGKQLNRIYNVNINFINQVDNSNFKIRTWEKGVNRETGSCGSGTLASFYYLRNHLSINKTKVKEMTAHYMNGEKTKVKFDNIYYFGGNVKEVII